MSAGDEFLSWQALMLDKKTINAWRTWALSDQTVRAVGSRIANLIDDAPGVIAKLLAENEFHRSATPPVTPERSAP